MEPTEAAEAAVWRVLERSDMDVVERQVVFDAVRAAFAAVPDPLELAKVWEADTTETWFQPEASEYAESLRTFMAGGGK